ncbi:MAG TPA: short-chain dehydrogenase, partial [Pusillimonas sp.]|nr:short-chain dehydrogenase [Pusillimonas sp.]
MQDMQEKVAIVTGGATLIGAAVAQAFHDRGAAVVIADIDKEGGTRVADKLGARALFIETDLADDTQIESCVRETTAQFG